MRLIPRGLIAALLSAFVLTGCGMFMSTQQRIAAARKDMQAGDWRRARIELNKVLESKGRHPEAWLLLAGISLDTGDSNGAKKALRSAIGAGAKGRDLDALRVRMWLATGQAKAALQGITQGKIQLGEPAQTFALAQADLALGRAPEAMKALQALLAGSRAPVEAHVLMAEALLAERQAGAALAEIDAANRADPKAVEPALLRGRVLASLGQSAAAESSLALALQRMPRGEPLAQRVEALIALTEVQLAQGKVDAASRTQATLTKLIHEAPYAQFLEARIKLARGDRIGAIEELGLIVANAPGFLQARLLLGAELLAGGDLEQAQAHLTRALQQEAGNLEARGLLATADLRLNQPNAVLTVLLPVLIAPNPEPHLLSLAGVAIGQLGNPNEVLSEFEPANGIKPDNEIVRLNLAQGCLSVARPDDALELLEQTRGNDVRRESLLIAALSGARGPRAASDEVAKLLAVRPQTPVALTVAAKYYASQRQFDRAQAVLRQAMKLDPGDPRLSLSLASVELASGDTAAAQLILRGLFAQHPDATGIRIALADALLRTRDFTQARQLLEAAQSSSNTGAAVEMALARVALAQGDLATANADLDRAIASQLDSTAAIEQAAILLVAAKQGDAALKRIHALLATNPDNPDALILEGEAEAALGHSVEAAAALAQAQKLRPSGKLAVSVYLQQVAAHEAQPQKPLVDWLANHPSDWSVREVLGEYDLEGRNFGPAGHEFETVLKQAPDDVTALNNLAWTYGMTGDSRAVSIAEKAYQLAPFSSNVIDTLGWILAREGKFNKALPLLGEAVKLNPGDPELEYHYAYTLLKSHRTAEARRILSKLVASSTPFESRSDAERLLRQ